MTIKNILCVDFSILVEEINKYLHGDGIEEYNYDKCTFLDTPLNMKLFYDIFDAIVSHCDRTKEESIHFTTRQEDILNFLKLQKNDNEEIYLYNIDLFSDTNEYNYIINNHSWVKYALDKNLITEYFWINSSLSTINKDNEEYFFQNFSYPLLASTMGDFDEIFISLSPEYVSYKEVPLFQFLISVFKKIKNYDYIIYENICNRLTYYNKEYDESNSYVTLLSTNSYLPAVLGLKASLDECGCKYPLTVICSNLLDKSTVTLLDTYNINYVIVNDIKKLNEDFIDTQLIIDEESKINKLHIFNLDSYEKLLFVDADYIVTNNLDYLFEAEEELIKDSSLFLTKPNKEVFNLLKDKYDKETISFNELFNNYFNDYKELKVKNNSLYHHKYWFEFTYLEKSFDYVHNIIKLLKRTEEK